MSRYVRVQKTQIKKIRGIDKGSYEGSPYWNFLTNTAQFNQEGELLEPRQANPDVLSEADGMYVVSEERREKQRLVQTAIKLAKLSKREREIVQMLTYTDMTQDAVADLLGISQPVVSTYYKRALNKIKIYIEKESK